jgi:hypothetical protein
VNHSKEPFRIELRIDRASARRALIVGSTLIVLGLASVGLAKVPITGSYQTGQLLTQNALDDNFSQVETRLAALESSQSRLVVTSNGRQYSVGAILCGLGPVTNGQITGGYVGAKTLCEKACGSVTAHMCANDEMVRSEQMGISPSEDAAWISTGILAEYGEPWSRDCEGWTNNSGTEFGVLWQIARPGITLCEGRYPIACCD